MTRYTVRLTGGIRSCWFAEWLDRDDTIPGVNYIYRHAARFDRRADAEAVAAQVPWWWLPVVEED